MNYKNKKFALLTSACILSLLAVTNLNATHVKTKKIDIIFNKLDINKDSKLESSELNSNLLKQKLQKHSYLKNPKNMPQHKLKFLNKNKKFATPYKQNKKTNNTENVEKRHFKHKPHLKLHNIFIELRKKLDSSKHKSITKKEFTKIVQNYKKNIKHPHKSLK